MANIQTEIKKSKKELEKKFDGDSAINSVKLLQAGDALEDARIARALGNNSIVQGETKLGMKLQLEKLDERYNGGIYLIDQIKEIAKKYNLRFLPAQYFSGVLAIEAIHKLKAFSKETGVEITDGNLKTNFFILAPEKEFKTILVLKPEKVIEPEPALFYRVDSEHYRMIHQWGKDFTIFNRIAGWKWASTTNYWFYIYALTCVYMSPLLLLYYAMKIDLKLWAAFTIAVAIWLAVSLFISTITYSNIAGDPKGTTNEENKHKHFKNKFHDSKWRSNLIHE